MAGYDVHIETVVISADSSFIGQKMKDIPFRTETGANIIKIQRGSRNILIPDGNTVIYPEDTLVAVGTTAQIAALRGLIDLCDQAGSTVAGVAIAIEKCFTGAGDALRAQGVRLESLAAIESMSEDSVVFRS